MNIGQEITWLCKDSCGKDGSAVVDSVSGWWCVVNGKEECRCSLGDIT